MTEASLQASGRPSKYDDREQRVYKVYVIWQCRPGESEVLREGKTVTPSPDAALAGWRYLYDQPLTPKHLLLLTFQGRQVAAYRYGTRPGETDYSPRDIQIPQ